MLDTVPPKCYNTRIMAYKHQIEIQELDDGSGGALIEFPPVLLKKLGWKEGDDLKFERGENGSIQIRKIGLESVELDFDEEELFKYMQFAHEQGMSFNELCSEALEDCLASDNPHLADHPFDPLDHEQRK